MKLLFAKALLDQSKGDRALPILDELMADGGLPPSTTAEITRLRAACFYLMSGSSPVADYHAAAEEAVVAAHALGDAELVAQALLEYAKCGSETGDEARVKNAQVQLDALVQTNAARIPPTAWYALAYCHYVAFDVRRAAECLQEAIQRLKQTTNTVALSLAYNALGVCNYRACDFPMAREALSKALDLSSKTGDDARVSLAWANLAALSTLQGKFSDAIDAGIKSISLAGNLTGQPRILNAYMNVAEAYMLSGSKGEAERYINLAKVYMASRRTWKTQLDFFCEGANLALMMGNISLALDLIGSAETSARGRENAISEAAMFTKLRAFKLAHLYGVERAWPIVEVGLAKFRACHPVFFLEVLAAKAWLEKRDSGSLTQDTLSELGLFEKLQARGLRAALTAQGFLS